MALMDGFYGVIDDIRAFVPLIRTIITVIVVFVIFSFIFRVVKKALLKRAKTKKQISNIEIFTRVSHYILFLILLIFGIFSYVGSWAGLGIGIGLFSAALGWALQKPITGIAGWIMVVTKRPFDIGDRVIIGKVRGDVADITLTHIYLKEIGGLVAGEENSGRIVMVPNSTLFEKNIINYTQQDEYILDQVTVTVTHESDLDKAIEIGLGAAKKITKGVIKEIKREPYVRTYFQPDGISVHTRYYAPAKRIQEFSSKVTKEMFDKIMKTKSVKIAHPHRDIFVRKGKMIS